MLLTGAPATLDRSASCRPAARRFPSSYSFSQGMAPILALIPDLAHWTPAEKRALVQIIRAKGAPRQLRYIDLLRQHTRLFRSLESLTRNKPAPPRAMPERSA